MLHRRRQGTAARRLRHRRLRCRSHQGQGIGQGGQPQRKTRILNGTGECYDYTRVVDGKSVAFYAAFNQQDRLTAAAYHRTCAEALAAGELDNSKPLE